MAEQQPQNTKLLSLFLSSVSSIEFQDGSGFESYNDNGTTRFRAFRSDGYTEIGFDAQYKAMNWIACLDENGELLHEN